MHATELRRSPRLNSAPAAVNAAGNGGCKKRKAEPRLSEGVPLRRSPRFSDTAGSGSASQSHNRLVKVCQCRSKLLPFSNFSVRKLFAQFKIGDNG